MASRAEMLQAVTAAGLKKEVGRSTGLGWRLFSRSSRGRAGILRGRRRHGNGFRKLLADGYFKPSFLRFDNGAAAIHLDDLPLHFADLNFVALLEVAHVFRALGQHAHDPAFEAVEHRAYFALARLLVLLCLS